MTTLRSDLISSVKQSQNFVRTNQFKVVIEPPRALSMTNSDKERLTLNAYSASIPGFAFEEYSRNHSGEVPDWLANSIAFNETTIRFYVSKDLFEHQFFLNWKDIVVDQETNRLGYHDDYKAPLIQVKLLSRKKEENVLKIFEYRDCIIKTVGDIDLSWADENANAILAISFRYKNFKMTDSPE